MIHHKDGDLLKSNCTVIMHQANCFSTMGAGIARSIAKLYPGAQMVDKDSPLTPEEKFGNYTVYKSEDGVSIVNLYGQYGFGHNKRQTNYDKLESAINKYFSSFNQDVVNENELRIGVPYKMGCDRAGGDWTVVEKILKRQSMKHDVEIYIYKL